MSTNWVRTAVLGTAACFMLGIGCDDNPVNENRDATAGLQVNPTFAVVDAADTTRISAVGVNRYGEETQTGVSFTACDAKVTVAPDPQRVSVEAPERVVVVGNTLGESCVTISGGGLSDEATVYVVPSSITGTLAATLQSGASAQATVEFLDKAGAPVSGFDISQVGLSIGNSAIADVDASGNVTAKAPGSTNLNVSLLSRWNAPRTVAVPFSVTPATFNGTIAPPAADFGDTVTVTAGAVAFDGDTEVTFDGFLPWVISSGATDIVVVAPAGMGSSPAEVLITGVGANQLAYADTIDVPNPCGPADCNEPNNGGGGGGLALSDLGAVTPASLPFNEYLVIGANDLDDVYEITLGAQTTINFDLDWQFDDADIDILYYDSNGDLIFDFGCATGSVPESCSATFAAGTYYIDVNVFDAHDHPYIITLLTMQ